MDTEQTKEKMTLEQFSEKFDVKEKYVQAILDVTAAIALAKMIGMPPDETLGIAAQALEASLNGHSLGQAEADPEAEPASTPETNQPVEDALPKAGTFSG